MSGLDREFDYLVPEQWGDLPLGSRVRIRLGPRRVGGWVVATDVTSPPEIELKPLAKRSGLGPAPELLELSSWAARRWAGRRAALLKTASPPRIVDRISPRPPPPQPSQADQLPSGSARQVPSPAVAQVPGRSAFDGEGSTLRLPPAADRWPVILEAAHRGDALILLPSLNEVERLTRRLNAEGVTASVAPRQWDRAAAGGVVVGARAGAWAPVRDLAAVVVVDEHDEGYQEQRNPTWHARDVAVERATRAGVPAVLVSPTPSLEALELRPLLVPPRALERDGWPIVQVIDRRTEEPGRRGGLFTEELARQIAAGGRIVCVLNRTGRARLLACDGCGELARCDECASAVRQDVADRFVCGRCAAERPQVCPGCGATRHRNLRLGVGRAREELEALAGEPVVSVTASSPLSDDELGDDARIFIGTEAVLHQVRRARVVAFLDFDQELLAPRYRAAEQAFAMVGRAARLVGPRSGEGRLILQTRQPDHEVVTAATGADPGRVTDAERARRQLLRFPPVSAMAVISGAGAADFVNTLDPPDEVDLMGPLDDKWLMKAPDHSILADTLAGGTRPKERLRIEVDPLRI